MDLSKSFLKYLIVRSLHYSRKRSLTFLLFSFSRHLFFLLDNILKHLRTPESKKSLIDNWGWGVGDCFPFLAADTFLNFTYVINGNIMDLPPPLLSENVINVTENKESNSIEVTIRVFSSWFWEFALLFTACQDV